MSDVNLSDPTYFPAVVYVYHRANFPSNFSFVIDLKDLPSDVVLVGRYEIKNVAQVNRMIHIQPFPRKKA